MSASDVLLSVSRGSIKTLPSSKTDGQILFTTDTEKMMVDFILDGVLKRSTINPNPDWNAESGNAAILNKPTIPTAITDLSGSDSFVKSNDSRLTDSRTPKSHTHGNLSNTGAITSDTAVASGDKLVVTDGSASSKLIRTGIAFDGSTTTKALTPKGTWEPFQKSVSMTVTNRTLKIVY